MNGSDSPKSLGKSFSVANKTVPTSNAPQCPWCPSPEEDSIDTHADWCDRKIMARIIDRGKTKKLKKNTVPMLEHRIKNIMTQLGEYETTLRLIAAPKRPDGTFNRDRESCRVLAENILKAYNSKV
jgi:hypothetical protein